MNSTLTRWNPVRELEDFQNRIPGAFNPDSARRDNGQAQLSKLQFLPACRGKQRNGDGHKTEGDGAFPECSHLHEYSLKGSALAALTSVTDDPLEQIKYRHRFAFFQHGHRVPDLLFKVTDLFIILSWLGLEGDNFWDGYGLRLFPPDQDVARQRQS